MTRMCRFCRRRLFAGKQIDIIEYLCGTKNTVVVIILSGISIYLVITKRNEDPKKFRWGISPSVLAFFLIIIALA